MKRLHSLLLACAASLAFGGCTPLLVQNPGQGLSPVNAISSGEDRHLMLFGYEVVSYFTERAERPGDPAIKSLYKGVTFRFSRPEHKALFDAAPEKYIPQFGGFCTNGIVYAVPWGGSVSRWEILDGKLYMFGGDGSHDAFMLRPRDNLALADRYWNEEVNGSNAFFQRTRRVIFRVPHWKTSAELAAEVARASK